MSEKSIAHAISGGISGLFSMAVTYPLVTLSTNAQTHTKESFDETAKEETIKTEHEIEIEIADEDEDITSIKSSLSKIPLRTVPRSVSQEFEVKDLKEVKEIKEKRDKNYKFKIIKIFKKIILRLKLLATHYKKFYSGLESALVGIVAVNFAYYYIYSYVGNHFKKLKKNNSLNVKDSLLTGLAAGIVSRILTNPIWVANTRMTVKKKDKIDNVESDVSQKNTLIVINEIYQNEGLKGLFSGLGPALILVSSPVIQFTIFEQLKNLLIKLRLNNKISSIDALLLGSLGKLIAILITYPYYTIRSRMHLDSNSNDNSFKFLFNIIKNEGVNSLYKGLNAKLLQSILSSGLIFYFKEELTNVVGTSLNSISNRTMKTVKVVSNFSRK